MTEEEYFRKNYPDFCYYDKPLTPYWDLFQYGVEFGERESEKEIEELKERLKEHESIGNAQFWENVWSWKTKAEQLTKTKELLNEFLDFESSCMERGIYISDKIRAEAKQFLKDSEVEK